MSPMLHDAERFYKFSKSLFAFFIWANVIAAAFVLIALVLGIRYSYLIPTNPRWINHNGTFAPLITQPK